MHCYVYGVSSIIEQSRSSRILQSSRTKDGPFCDPYTSSTIVCRRRFGCVSVSLCVCLCLSVCVSPIKSPSVLILVTFLLSLLSCTEFAHYRFCLSPSSRQNFHLLYKLLILSSPFFFVFFLFLLLPPLCCCSAYLSKLSPSACLSLVYLSKLFNSAKHNSSWYYSSVLVLSLWAEKFDM